MSPFKICFKCGTEKPLEDFHKHPQMADGHLGKCKLCACKDVKKNREKHIIKYLLYDQQRRKTKNRPRDRNAKTHWTVMNAKRSGKLKPSPCEACGDPVTHAHHKDHAKPFDITWLCRRCHAKAHGCKFFLSDLLSTPPSNLYPF